MELAALIRVLLRRWSILLVLLTASAVAGAHLLKGLSPSYEGQSSALVVAPYLSDAGVATDFNGNPYADVYTTASMLVAFGNSSTVHTNVERQGALATYKVSLDGDKPLVVVDLHAGTPSQVVSTNRALFEAMTAEIARRQQISGVPPTAAVQLSTVSSPTQPRLLTKQRKRMLVLVGAAGGLGSLALTLLADTVLSSRRPDEDGLSDVASDGGMSPQDGAIAVPAGAAWDEFG